MFTPGVGLRTERVLNFRQSRYHRTTAMLGLPVVYLGDFIRYVC